MIVWKQWRKPARPFSTVAEHIYEGWFLFGFIPLYIRRHGAHRG